MTDIKVHQVPDLKQALPPVYKEIEALFDRIRHRAFELFNGRGSGEGRAMDDWLAAERELCWPACELREQDEGYRLSVALPGFEPAEVSVTATPQDLIVHASRKSSTRDAREDPACVRWSDFRSEDACRKVTLEKPIDLKSVAASMKDGLLVVTARKAGVAKRAVEVAAAA